jgi:hypothetical protein
MATRSCEVIPGRAKAFHAKAQRIEGAKKTKLLFFTSPCALASLREIVYFFIASVAVGHNLSALTGLNWATITHVFWRAVRELPLLDSGLRLLDHPLPPPEPGGE